MSFQPHSQKMVLTVAEENELYRKVLKFLEEFLLNKTLYSKMFETLNKKRSSKKVGSVKQE